MRASVSVIKACAAGSRQIFGRKIEPFRTFSSALLTVQSSSFKDDQVESPDNFISVTDNEHGQDVHATGACISVESTRANYRFSTSFSGNDIFESVTKENVFLCWFDQDTEDVDRLKRIKSILENRGWNLCYHESSCIKIDLDEQNIVLILNDLYKETRDAALAFFFYQWSECCRKAKHGLHTICTMVHILTAGNMNHRSKDLIFYLVLENDGEDKWHLLMKVLYETHIDKKVLGTAYSMLVDCYLKVNMTDIALKLGCQMKHYNFFPSLGVINLLIRRLLQSDQMELAWDYLEKIQSQGFVVDAAVMSLFVHNYCRKGNLKCAWKILMEMKNYRINPDVVVYTIIINSLCKKCLLKEATSLVFKMVQMGIAPDSVSLSSMIDGFCKMGKFEKAIDILKIFRLPPNIYIYDSFISKLCRDGNMDIAYDIFQEMMDSGLRPDCYSYTTMIGGYCKLNDLNTALMFWGKMLKRGIKASVATYTTVIDSCCKSGNVDTAEHLFLAMIKEGLVPDIAAYNTLINGYGKKGHLQKAFGILDMMRSADVCPDIVTYNTIIHRLILRGFVNEAKDVLDELIRRGFSPDVVTFTNLVSGYSTKGNFEEAYLMWFYMSEPHMKPDVVMCSALLYGYCRVSRMEEANALFTKMLHIGLVPDVILYNTLIHGFCYVGYTDDACQLVDMMVKQGIMPNDVTYQALVFGYKNNRAQNPVRRAAFKVQKVLLKYGYSTDVNWC